MSEKDIKLTPMMRQYREVKKDIPDDAILLFRLGDFYEIFFEDADIAAPILEIVKTKRAGTPMCGIPFHALDNYLPRLLEAGVKVAIAEQIEDPKTAKGIVKRAVSRIITPGTVTDQSVLSPDQNNFLTALYKGKSNYGLASLDISTGDFRITEVKTIDELETELHRLQSKECAAPESLLKLWKENDETPNTVQKILWTSLDDWIFELENANELLKRHFKVATLDGFGCRSLNSAICAAGAVLQYATENLKQTGNHIKTLKTYQNDKFMILDYISQRNLELITPLMGTSKENTLIKVLDKTVTPMGSRLLREWILKPLYDKNAIVARLNVVGSFKNDPMTLAEIQEIVGTIRDLERIIARLNIGSANARDMLTLAYSLNVIPDIKELLDVFDIPLISNINKSLNPLPELVNKINESIMEDPALAITDGGIIKKGYNKELDELRSAATEGKNWLAKLQSQEQEKTGIRNIKIRYNKVFGYYIEVSKGQVNKVPENYIRKQTLVNAERYITPELKEIENKILGAEDKSKAIEYNLFQNIRAFSLDFTEKIQKSAIALANIDAITALAECARIYNYVKPTITDSNVLYIKGGRHPVLDSQMQANERFVPNDTKLDGDENRMMIITGPNMAGKSTYIRQTAMLVLMAQIGSFIPADSAEIGLVDRIFTRVGAADDISRGQSTFMVEMVETANILNNATNKSLVILDEIGRGTSTFDGLSIAWAVAEYLHDNPKSCARTQFATHYHELTELALTRKGVKNYNVAVREYGDQIIFLRQIIEGGTDKSYGIHVAKLAGLPNDVIKRANEVLENLENNAMDNSEPALAKHTVEEVEDNYDSEPFQPSLF